jgi:hypothetical protein
MTSKGITWLASYPKSGNTWARLFLQAYGDDAEIYINAEFGKIGHDADRRVWQEVLRVDSVEAMDAVTEWEFQSYRGAALVRWYKHYGHGNAICLKTHTPRWTLDGLETIPTEMSRAAIYIVRDPRDVAVSFADHLGMTIDEVIDFMRSPNAQLRMDGKRENLADWSINVGSWTQGATFPVHVLRYEDMHAAPLVSFGQIAVIFGHELDKQRLERAIERVSFDRLQRQEQEAGGFINQSPHQERFFRSGKIGDWRDVLTEAQAAEIERDHGETMEQFGYERTAAVEAA